MKYIEEECNYWGINMKYRDLFTDYDEEEILRFENYLTRLSSVELEDLYDYLIQVSVDEDFNIDDTILDGRISIKGSNRVEFHGSGEHSSQESSTYLDIYLDNILLGELVYDLGQAFASECVVLSLEFIEEENALAKLSMRMNSAPWENCGKPTTPKEQIEHLRKETTIKQENTTMTTNTLRTLNLSLLDLSPELKGENKVVYEKANVRTEYTDEQTIQNLLATGDVLSALQLHNKNVRVKTLDSQYKGSAREVFLEPIDHLGDSSLRWEVVRVG